MYFRHSWIQSFFHSLTLTRHKQLLHQSDQMVSFKLESSQEIAKKIYISSVESCEKKNSKLKWGYSAVELTTSQYHRLKKKFNIQGNASILLFCSW